jgi:hypothetical protein
MLTKDLTVHRMRLKNRQSSASESTKGDSTVDQEKTSSDGMDEIAKYIKSRYVLFFSFRDRVCARISLRGKQVHK